MIKQFLNDETGQDIVEYSLLLVLIGAGAVLVLTGMGTNIGKIFQKIAATVSDAESNVKTPTGN